MHRIWLAAVAVALTGCGPQLLVKVDAPPSNGVDTAYVRDEAGRDRYPSFAGGEGNIYSCRYGIHGYLRSELDPPKEELFARLLAEAKPAIVAHDVRLERFDIYRNWRTRLLRFAGQTMGGAVVSGQAHKLDAEHNPDVVQEAFSLQQDPGDGRGARTENQIGCDGVGEGEYFPSEVTRGHDVIVIWLNFKVDGQPYRFRSMYQFQYTDLPGNDKAVADAIKVTIREVAKKLPI